MGGNAVEVEGVSKRYRIGATAGSMREALTGAFRRHRPREEIWALRDVTLSVPQGAAVGVIGRNGAGKSTLLKILSRIVEPSAGVARTRGRVASLLEVGTGFHPELTGRENVFLNGAVLGLRRREVRARFDEIIAFAGVERFVDTPVKRYSSGMYLRLAFGVAAHLEPDVLVVDEVLAVGDAEFQRRCLGRMEAVGREGRTVVFVSHDLDAIARLCPMSYWLDDGQVAGHGPSTQMITRYLALADRVGDAGAAAVARGPVVVDAVAVLDASGRAAGALRRDEPFSIAVSYRLTASVPGFDLAVFITSQRGARVIDEACSDVLATRPSGPGSYCARVRIPPVLNVGRYAVGLWMGTTYETILDESAVSAFVLEGSDHERPDRVVALAAPWDLETR